MQHRVHHDSTLRLTASVLLAILVFMAMVLMLGRESLLRAVQAPFGHQPVPTLRPIEQPAPRPVGTDQLDPSTVEGADDSSTWSV